MVTFGQEYKMMMDPLTWSLANHALQAVDHLGHFASSVARR
jgi:hypothetical protein